MFVPYEIKHIQLSEVAALAPPKGKHYLVFWYNQYPLGHIWYERDLDRAGFRSQIIQSITPALDHYLQAAGHIGYKWDDDLFHAGFSSTKLYQMLDGMAKPKAVPETITVAISTRNRPHELKKCIEQLRKCTDQDFELLIVDNASDTAETREVVESFEGVRYVREDRKGASIGRNTGIQHATNDIIAFTDDDVLVDKDWITRVKEGFENPLTMALTGLTIPLELTTKSQYIFERDWGFNKGYLPKTFDYEYVQKYVDAEEAIPVWDVGAGANMAFRKDVFKMVGGLDDRMGAGGSGCCEDSEMWYRIMAAGWNCFYMPSLVVYHQHRKTMGELKRQLYLYMRGHVSALLMQYDRYGYIGDVKRVKKFMPYWYLNRVKRFLRTGDFTLMWSWLTEVRGCLAGLRFYKMNTASTDTSLFDVPQRLSNTVKADSDTLVTVIITCYNYGRYLRHAIESVKAQTHQNCQIVVVDDGSTDETAAICAAYPDIAYVKTKRVGVSMARNSGVLYSKGSHIWFLDADDWLYPDALEVQLRYFNEFPEAAFVAGGFDRVAEDGKLVTDQPDLKQHRDGFFRHLLMGNFIGMQSNVMYRRDLFFDFYFDSKMNGCEDYDLNLRISRHLPALSHQHKIVAYRMHGNSLSSNIAMMKEQVQRVLAKQEPLLRTLEERTAFKQGIRNWNAYYSAAMNTYQTNGSHTLNDKQ